MKKEDLMISDWVKKPSYMDIESLKIGQIELDDFIAEEEYGVLSACEPISLTSEILEKNGYVFQDWWYEQEGYPDITNIFSDDMYEVGKHTYYGKGQPEFSSIIKIRYVHELQHALRLCGIKKEIIL